MNYKKQFEEFLADDLDSFTQMYTTSKWRIGIDIMKSEDSPEIILHRFRFQRINARQFEHSKAYYEEANVKMKQGEKGNFQLLEITFSEDLEMECVWYVVKHLKGIL